MSTTVNTPLPAGPPALAGAPAPDQGAALAGGDGDDRGGQGVVLVGCDGSPASQAAVDFAVREAALRGGRVIAVAAFTVPDHAYRAVHGTTKAQLVPKMTEIVRAAARRTLDRAVQHAGSPALDIDLRVVEGRPSELLLAASHEAGLLVVGARGMGGWGRLILGSVSTEVIHHAHLPVVVVPAPHRSEAVDDRPDPDAAPAG